MLNTDTLKKNYEFQNVLSKGKFYVGKQITIYISTNKLDENVIGIAVSTKACNAVRLIRENYRLIKNDLKKGNNIVFLWNKKVKAEEADYYIIKKDMNKLLQKANLLS